MLRLGKAGTVAQNLTPAGAALTVKPQAASARLILQDPLAFEQAIQPSLKSSFEMMAEPTGGMDREKARELWESLSLEPEIAQEKQAERKRLLARAEQMAQEAVQAKAQSAALQAELTRARDERLNHPLVYVGTAGLLGLGALWWLERRKRMALQDRELAGWPSAPSSQPREEFFLADQQHAQHSQLEDEQSVFSIDEAPHLEPLASDLKRMKRSPQITGAPSLHGRQVDPQVDAPTQESAAVDGVSEEQLLAQSWKKKDTGLRAISQRILSSAIGRKLQYNSSKFVNTDLENHEKSTLIQPDQAAVSAQILHDTATDFQEVSDYVELAHGQSLQSQYSTDQDNIDLLSRTRVKASQGQDAVEHLLELRMAVNGLRALGRALGAKNLLLEHVDSSPDTCAWAYLEHMNLCEQLDLREEFETMRKRYRQQFNRMAPYWQEPNAKVIGLDGYTRATHELCAAWTQGRETASATLAAWLAGPLLGRKLVQLPAYHDLFDLYELLEFLQALELHESAVQTSQASAAGLPESAQTAAISPEAWLRDVDAEFVPTVSLLDLDYEFSSDVTLQEREVEQSEKAVTIVKPGNFSVDFNVTGTQLGGLFSQPAELDKK